MAFLPLLLAAPAITSVLPIITIAIAFGVGITALFYIASYVLESSQLQALAKEQLAATILTIFIVAVWWVFDATFDNIACSMITGSCNVTSGYIPPTHLGIAYSALEIVFAKLKSIYMSLYIYEVLIGFLSTVYVPMGTFNPLTALLPISFPPLVGLNMLSNAHTILVESIGTVMMAIIVKQHILNFAMYAIPTVLLPLGIALRCIPFFRTTGSSIIAICIAGYFIYPFSILLSNYMIFDKYVPVDTVYVPSVIGFCQKASGDTSDADALARRSAEINQFRKDWEGEISKAGKTEGFDWASWSSSKDKIVGGMESVFESTTKILGFMFRLFGEFSLGAMSILWGAGGNYGVIAGLFNFVLEEVAMVSQFVVVVVVTSVIEIILTITMYRNVAHIIGGEMDIAGLSKLV